MNPLTALPQDTFKNILAYLPPESFTTLLSTLNDNRLITTMLSFYDDEPFCLKRLDVIKARSKELDYGITPSLYCKIADLYSINPQLPVFIKYDDLKSFIVALARVASQYPIHTLDGSVKVYLAKHDPKLFVYLFTYVYTYNLNKDVSVPSVSYVEWVVNNPRKFRNLLFECELNRNPILPSNIVAHLLTVEGCDKRLTTKLGNLLFKIGEEKGWLSLMNEASHLTSRHDKYYIMRYVKVYDDLKAIYSTYSNGVALISKEEPYYLMTEPTEYDWSDYIKDNTIVLNDLGEALALLNLEEINKIYLCGLHTMVSIDDRSFRDYGKDRKYEVLFAGCVNKRFKHSELEGVLANDKDPLASYIILKYAKVHLVEWKSKLKYILKTKMMFEDEVIEIWLRTVRVYHEVGNVKLIPDDKDFYDMLSKKRFIEYRDRAMIKYNEILQDKYNETIVVIKILTQVFPYSTLTNP